MNNKFQIGKIKFSYSTLFIIIIIVISFVYNYNKIIFERPVGIHQWRNCVSAGYALNLYYTNDFFHPGIGCLITDDYTTDVVILECPLLYYAVSLLYKIFGYQEFLYRLFNIIIGFTGLYYLFKTARSLLENNIVAIFTALLVFTSTVFVFYINNYITDATALAISFIGLYKFCNFYHFNKYKHFILSMTFFLIAGLLKAQALILFFAILSAYFFELVFNVKFGKNGSLLFNRSLKYIIGFLVVITIIIMWYYYARNYKDMHGGMSSIRLTSNIFQQSRESIVKIWHELCTRFNAGYFHSPRLLILSALLFIYNLIFLKKFNRLLNFLTILVFIQGLLIFNIVFYFSIARCDYYQINNLVFMVLLFINFFLHLQNNYPKLLNSIYLKIAIIIIGILLINDCRKGINNKYSDWHYNYSRKIVEQCGEITPYLRNLGIERTDRVYFTPDPSMNISLYLMNQLGNTDFALYGNTKQKIEFLKTRDLKYVMIADENILKEEDLSNLLSNKIGEYNDVHIFKVFDD